MKKPHHIAERGHMKQENGMYVIYPRALNIVWGDDSRYWNLDKSKVEGVATLIQVSWLDVSGMVEDVRPGKYKVKFDVKLKPDAFGWTGSPVLVMAKVGKKGKYEFSEITLTPADDYKAIPEEGQEQKQVEVEVKSNPPSPEDKKIYFGLYEIWSGKWKGGLQIRKVTVEPV